MAVRAASASNAINDLFCISSRLPGASHAQGHSAVPLLACAWATAVIFAAGLFWATPCVQRVDQLRSLDGARYSTALAM
jgi:hypothetical protein